MHELINVFLLQFAISQNLITAVFFVINCKELKNVQNAQINKLFRFFNFISTYGDVFYGLTRLVMSKNVNNDFRKDSPIIKTNKQNTSKQTEKQT